MKGYKATDKDGKCRDVEFKIGKTYTIDGAMQICKNGFHFCQNAFDVYSYYSKDVNTRIFEVEALGEVFTENDKSVTNKIKILRELTEKELLNIWINGTNSSNRNSGYGNSGNRNSGDWNSGDGNSGYFNTLVPVYFFNKPSNMKYTQEFENKIRSLNVKPILLYVNTVDMSEEEKLNNPSHKVTGGFLRKTGRHDFRYLTEQDKEFIKSLPNFDATIFKQITNVDLDQDVKIKQEIEELELKIKELKGKLNE